MLDGQLGLLKTAVDDGDLGRLAALVREAAPVFKRPVEPGGSKNLLMYAIQQRRTDMALLLIEERAGVDWYVRGGRTALHHACEAGESTLVSALLEKGADLTRDYPEGSQTPLHLAVDGGHTRIVTMLLTHPSFAPALWKRESYQAIWQAVQQAMRRDSVETMQALMEHGVGHLEHPGSFWASRAADVLVPSICRGTAATFLQVGGLVPAPSQVPVSFLLLLPLCPS
jgi:ankyrin repeat protein